MVPKRVAPEANLGSSDSEHDHLDRDGVYKDAGNDAPDETNTE